MPDLTPIHQFIHQNPPITMDAGREAYLATLLPRVREFQVVDHAALLLAESLAAELSQTWLQNFCEQEMLRSRLLQKVGQVTDHFGPSSHDFVVRRLCEVAKSTQYELTLQAQCLLNAELSLRQKIAQYCQDGWDDLERLIGKDGLEESSPSII